MPGGTQAPHPETVPAHRTRRRPADRRRGSTIAPAAARDSVMLDLIRLCLSRTHAAPPGPERPACRHRGVARAREPYHAGKHPRRTIKMPLPQVNDRLKEMPAQALRTVFATVGQLLLAADRLRARAAEQLSGSDEATDAAPSQQAPPARQAPPGTQAPPHGRPRPRDDRRSRPRGAPRTRGPRGGGPWTRRATSGCSMGTRSRTRRTSPPPQPRQGPRNRRRRPRSRPPPPHRLHLPPRLHLPSRSRSPRLAQSPSPLLPSTRPPRLSRP